MLLLEREVTEFILILTRHFNKQRLRQSILIKFAMKADRSNKIESY
jgi:hypothetical protein